MLYTSRKYYPFTAIGNIKTFLGYVTDPTGIPYAEVTCYTNSDNNNRAQIGVPQLPSTFNGTIAEFNNGPVTNDTIYIKLDLLLKSVKVESTIINYQTLKVTGKFQSGGEAVSAEYFLTPGITSHPAGDIVSQLDVAIKSTNVEVKYTKTPICAIITSGGQAYQIYSDRDSARHVQFLSVETVSMNSRTDMIVEYAGAYPTYRSENFMNQEFIKLRSEVDDDTTNLNESINEINDEISDINDELDSIERTTLSKFITR